MHRQRNVHGLRPVIICQDNHYNTNPTFPIITVAPLSTKCYFKTKLDYELLCANEPVEQNSYIRLYLLQPVLKVNLAKYIDKITQDSIDEVKAILFFYFGFM